MYNRRWLWFVVSMLGVILAAVLAGTVKTHMPEVVTAAPLIPDAASAFVRWVALITAFVLLFGFTAAIGALNHRLTRTRQEAPHDRSSMWLGMAHSGSLLSAAVFPWLGWGLLPVGEAFAWLGIVLLVAGFSLQGVAMITLRALYSLSLDAHVEQHVVTRGPYRFVRHPGYLAQLVFWFGLALATRNALVIAVVVLADLFVYLHRSRVEERLLLGTVGEAYRAYAARTRRLLPGIW
jgi:protein-S-isoprenylcysteine O-methyltransferase Ste14